MAKYFQGILGPFQGKVGTVVGYMWRDKWCMRARPRCYHDRQSDAQLAQRSRFKQMIQFASPATPLLKRGLRAMAAAEGLTEGNCFLRINHGCFPGESGNSGNSGISGFSGIDYRGLQFSRGTLPAVQGVEYERGEGGAVEVRWARGLGRGSDTVHVYAYCPAAATGLAVAAAERGRRGVRFLLPEGFAMEEVHLWVFAEGKDGNVSATQYATPKEADASPTLPTAFGGGDAEPQYRSKALDTSAESDSPPGGQSPDGPTMPMSHIIRR